MLAWSRSKMNATNSHGQPIGAALPHWTPPAKPPQQSLAGRTCELQPLSLNHVRPLYEADLLDPTGKHWTYKTVGPFESEQDFAVWVAKVAAWDDMLFYAVISHQLQRAVGLAAYLRVTPVHGCIEIGALYFSPLMQRTTTSTESLYLMMRHVFDDLGYRRCEWKCDRLNEPSRQAALRLGFRFEGTFQDAVVYKGRSRDTDWFAITAAEWPAIRAKLESWLEPANFDEQGLQRRSLGEF
jgi:RimJ/RimL family protein N-acetyltransferase